MLAPLGSASAASAEVEDAAAATAADVRQPIDVVNTDEERAIRTKKVPAMPTLEERLKHEQVRRPLGAWRGTCVQAFKRDEPHRRVQHELSELTRVEMDFCCF